MLPSSFTGKPEEDHDSGPPSRPPGSVRSSGPEEGSRRIVGKWTFSRRRYDGLVVFMADPGEPREPNRRCCLLRRALRVRLELVGIGAGFNGSANFDATL
jgi:hypothetical protein